LILWCKIVGKDYRKCTNDDFLGLFVGEEAVNCFDQVAYGFDVAGSVGYDFLQYFAQKNAHSDAWKIVSDLKDFFGVKDVTLQELERVHILNDQFA
jgi:hypothetical protein